MIDCDDCGMQIGSFYFPICVVPETASRFPGGTVCPHCFKEAAGRPPELHEREYDLEDLTLEQLQFIQGV